MSLRWRFALTRKVVDRYEMICREDLRGGGPRRSPPRRKLDLTGDPFSLGDANQHPHHPLREDEVAVDYRDRRPLPQDG